MTSNELEVLRMNLVGGMNEYVKCMNDEKCLHDMDNVGARRSNRGRFTRHRRR